MNKVGLKSDASYTSSAKNKKKSNIKGSFLALGGSALGQTAASVGGLVPLHFLKKISGTLSKDQVEIINNGADKIVSEMTNLGQKGVKITHLDSAHNLSGIPDKLYSIVNPIFAVAKGENACFLNKNEGFWKKNMVLINKDKFSPTVFHELGHAFNFNNSDFWKSMQSMRIPAMVLAGLFALIPALTKEAKAVEGEELTKGQKFKNGLRKASPALAFISMLPVFSEELMASIRGCKWAKQLLEPALYKKIFKTNAIAYTSYIIAALSFSAGALAAKKIKDKSQK